MCTGTARQEVSTRQQYDEHKTMPSLQKQTRYGVSIMSTTNTMCSTENNLGKDLHPQSHNKVAFPHWWSGLVNSVHWNQTYNHIYMAFPIATLSTQVTCSRDVMLTVTKYNLVHYMCTQLTSSLDKRCCKPCSLQPDIAMLTRFRSSLHVNMAYIFTWTLSM